MSISSILINEQKLLYEVSRRLNQDLDINRVLADVLDLTLNCVGANVGSIIIFDEHGSVAHKILARQKMPTEKANLVISEVLTQGLAGWIARQRQGVLIPDVTCDPRWITFADDEFIGGAAIGVPLIRRDRLVGVLTLRHTQAGYFDDAHLALVSSIAEQSAIAIENARLYYAVQTERAKLEAVIDSAGDAILVTDADGLILRMNALARQVFNVPKNYASENMPLSEMCHDSPLLALWQKCKTGGQPCMQELKMNNGRFFEVGITATPEVGFVIVMHDVTSLKELDTLRNDFISTISHDLRSPLQLIYTYTSLLMDNRSITRQQIEFLEGINRSAKKISDLLDNLFELMRVSAGIGMQAEACDLTLLIRHAVDRFEPMAALKGLTIEVKIADELPPAYVNSRRIDQVLSNLIDNAIKYTQQGQITIEATADENQICVQVTDTGIGLMPEEQKQLFSRFYRARNELTKGIDGTGLGLALSKSIVEQYGGQMWVSSTWQKGSTFAFTLPQVGGKGE